MTLDALPLALCAVLLGLLGWFRIHLAELPASPTELPAFFAEFAAIARLERIVVFPVGVSTSIATWLVMLRHGLPRSRRGALQAAAALVLFVSGLLSSLVGDPLARAILGHAGDPSPDGLAGLVDRWAFGHSLQLVLAVAVLGCLAAAARQPASAVSTEIGGLSDRHRTLLFLLGTATLFEGYDAFIVSMALPYIGRDLGASEATLGFALAAIRVGALASIALGRLADRRGRRNLLLATIVAYTLATAATGLSRGVTDFVAFQLIAQIFLVTELAIAQVVVAEEFPTSFRSLGQGLLGAFGALGAGLAAVLFPAFQETALGWRGLYFVGILPLLLTAYLRRSLPETERWQRARSAGATDSNRVTDLVRGALAARFFALLAIAFAIGACAGPAFAFASYRATRAFAWTPSEVSAMVLLGGGTGMLGWFFFGWLAERSGRRRVAALTLLGMAASAWAYFGSSWLWPSFAALVFTQAGTAVAVNALGTEVFPTALRGTAKSWISNSGVIGAVAGMAAVGIVGPALGGADATIRLLALLPVAVIVAVAGLPEPRGVELDRIDAEPGVRTDSVR